MKVTQHDRPDGTRVINVDPGNQVFCDGCNKDWTGLPDSGGLLLGSYAYGPCCDGETLSACERYKETHLIKARCPEGKSFADWVRQDLR